GAERAGYCAAVTRTIPTGPRYEPAQRDLYDAVLAAQLAAIAAVAPGTTLEAVHKTALRVLAEALIAHGVLHGTVDEVLEKETYKRFYMHRTSHWLGRDVHDVGRYAEDGTPRALEPGIVLTVQPGLYIPAGAEDVPAPYRGVGIRIEDDVLVTEAGREVRSAAAPPFSSPPCGRGSSSRSARTTRGCAPAPRDSSTRTLPATARAARSATGPPTTSAPSGRVPASPQR